MNARQQIAVTGISIGLGIGMTIGMAIGILGAHYIWHLW